MWNSFRYRMIFGILSQCYVADAHLKQPMSKLMPHNITLCLQNSTLTCELIEEYLNLFIGNSITNILYIVVYSLCIISLFSLLLAFWIVSAILILISFLLIFLLDLSIKSISLHFWSCEIGAKWIVWLSQRYIYSGDFLKDSIEISLDSS